MKITYTFTDIDESVLTGFVQEINRRDGSAGDVNLACSLAGNLSSSSLTINCTRADSYAGWSYPYSLLVTLFH